MGRGPGGLLILPSCPKKDQLLCSLTDSCPAALEGPLAPSPPVTTHTQRSLQASPAPKPLYLRLELRTNQADLAVSFSDNWKTRQKADTPRSVVLTWLKIALYNYLILLLISPSNDKVILRADEPQELLKPAKLHQSMGGKPHWASRMFQRYFLCQSLRIHNLVSTTYKRHCK